MNEVWGRCAEEVSLDLTGSFWTNLLPRVKNEATIKVFASQASEESDWETTAYGLSKRLVSRSSFSEAPFVGLYCLSVGLYCVIRPGGRVVMQRTANPRTPVQFRPRPPKFRRE